MRLFTIGFTRKSAETFFGMLRSAQVAKVIDTRLNNTSQLAGFAKQDDLRFLLKAVADIGYSHEPLLAPNKDLLDAYKKNQINWGEYEDIFRRLMASRRVDQVMNRGQFDGGCLLCSEEKPDHCHRRLVAEYLREHWGNVEIVHLV